MQAKIVYLAAAVLLFGHVYQHIKCISKPCLTQKLQKEP